MITKKGQPASRWIGFRGTRFIQRDTVRSEIWKPSLSNSPWMRGAPQVEFSSTLRKISSRTCFEILFLPHFLTLEIRFQYKRKPQNRSTFVFELIEGGT